MTFATKKGKIKGFTLVELVIVIAIIGVLATLVVVSFDRSRTTAFNTNVKGAVQSYSQALELYYAQNHTYFVYDQAKGCTAAPVSPPLTNRYNLQGTGLGCVGLNGSGEGRMTRRGGNNSDVNSFTENGNTYTYPSSTSIADELADQGFLKEVRAYPDSTSYTTNDPDFVLTLCDSAGKEASSISSATNYAVYTAIKGTLSPGDQETSSHLCGSSKSAYPWNITEDWPQ